MSRDNERHLWQEYIDSGGQDHKIVRRMFLDYSRYFEANLLINWFKDNNIPLDFTVLDYGCGVGDYGISFLRHDAKQVVFFDYPRAVKFVKYRLSNEGFDVPQAIIADADEWKIDDFQKFDMIIFGEVLEHLDNPAAVIAECNRAAVKYIMTSSYPYRTDDPDDPYWNNHDHDDDARIQQPECRKILEDNYNYVKFDGELRLWTRR